MDSWGRNASAYAAWVRGWQPGQPAGRRRPIVAPLSGFLTIDGRANHRHRLLARLARWLLNSYPR